MHVLFVQVPPAAGHDESHPFGGWVPPPLSCWMPESLKLPKPPSPVESSPPPELLLPPPSEAAKVLPGLLVPQADTMAATATAHTIVFVQFPRERMRETVAAHPAAPVRSASRRGRISGVRAAWRE
jgi:hypothetical protein